MAKKFMFVCFGILALAAAYSFGARDSVAQSGAPVFAGIAQVGNATCAITSSGDVYAFGALLDQKSTPPYVYFGWAYTHIVPHWSYLGNVLDTPVNTNAESLGGVKSLFR